MSLELIETAEVAFLYDITIRSQFCTVLPGMVEKVKSKKLYNHKPPCPLWWLQHEILISDSVVFLSLPIDIHEHLCV